MKRAEMSLVDLMTNQVEKGRQKTVMAAVFLFLLAPLICTGAFATAGRKNQSGPRVYLNGAVASDAGPCSEVGRDILIQGGSAVDGAIAALLCIGLMNPHSMGIGGGGFFTIFNASTGKVETINAREAAPRNAKGNRHKTEDSTLLAALGAEAIAVPGELRGYELAHKRHGKLPWKDLFQPSIRLAEEGFPVGKALGKALAVLKNSVTNNPSLCEVFCGTDGDVLKENDTIVFTKLAQTYRKIAEEGAGAFYQGELGQNFVADIQAEGSLVTMEDLRNYEAILDENPIKADLGEYKVFLPTAPAGGPVLGLILNILNGYNWTKDSVSSTDKKILTYHRMLEASRFGFAQRSFLGDPRYVNISHYIETITSRSFADQLREKITDDTTHPREYYGVQLNVPEDHGTTHISVLAEDGSAVSATTSINFGFGAKIRSRSTGIIANNQLEDFSTQFRSIDMTLPLPQNTISPGKRPFASSCPTIILDKNNKVKLVLGGSGGIRINSALTQVIFNTLFFDYDLEKAISLPRLHNQLEPNTTMIEPGFDQAVIDGLEAKNFKTELATDECGVVQAVVRQEDGIHAKSDDRKYSYAAGY